MLTRMTSNMLRIILVVLSVLNVATANWNGNLNFRSPSFNHDSLGISLSKVQRRMLTKRDGTIQHQKGLLNFTHGVASVSLYQHLGIHLLIGDRVTHGLHP